MPDLTPLRHPALLAHTALVVLLLVLSPVLGGDDGNVAQLGLVVLSIPWSAFVLGSYETTFSVLVSLTALLNVGLHGWARVALRGGEQAGYPDS